MRRSYRGRWIVASRRRTRIAGCPLHTTRVPRSSTLAAFVQRAGRSGIDHVSVRCVRTHMGKLLEVGLLAEVNRFRGADGKTHITYALGETALSGLAASSGMRDRSPCTSARSPGWTMEPKARRRLSVSLELDPHLGAGRENALGSDGGPPDSAVNLRTCKAQRREDW